MGLVAGSITYRKYRVTEELPRSFKEALVQNLPRHAFRDIHPQTNPEQSIGWTNPFDQLDANLNLEKVLFGKYLLLGMRKDRKSVQPALFKARVSEVVKAQMRERRGRKLSREELTGLKEMVKEKMLAEASPVTNFYEVVWNYETQEVYFSSQAGKAAIEFAELFEETFQLPLEEMNLVTRAERFIYERGLDVELVDVEASNFGS